MILIRNVKVGFNNFFDSFNKYSVYHVVFMYSEFIWHNMSYSILKSKIPQSFVLLDTGINIILEKSVAAHTSFALVFFN